MACATKGGNVLIVENSGCFGGMATIGKVPMFTDGINFLSGGFGTIRELTVCDKFSAKLLNLNERMDIYSADSFVSLIVLEGKAIIEWNDGEINANKGDSIFVPANFKAEIKGNAERL